jgi:hypothetical protein
MAIACPVEWAFTTGKIYLLPTHTKWTWSKQLMDFMHLLPHSSIAPADFLVYCQVFKVQDLSRSKRSQTTHIHIHKHVNMQGRVCRSGSNKSGALKPLVPSIWQTRCVLLFVRSVFYKSVGGGKLCFCLASWPEHLSSDNLTDFLFLCGAQHELISRPIETHPSEGYSPFLPMCQSTLPQFICYTGDAHLCHL